MSAFTINGTTGALTAVLGSPFTAGDNPSALAIDSTGMLLYIANANSDNVSAFEINTSTGALTEMENSPFAAGDQPFGMPYGNKSRGTYVSS